jgi:DNA-directed RNA polymerase specialized sigma24 family protein
MPVSAATIAGARTFDPEAVHELFESVYPAVHRVAHALAGREDVARGVIRFVMTHAPKQLPAWKDESDARRWFLHHAVLTTRRASPNHAPAPREDLLADGGPPEFVAFVKALRTLPHQQAEAFLLHHGEHLADRSLATAMDCSTAAAAQHLTGAHDALRPIGGEQFAAFVERIAERHRALTPADDVLEPSVRGYVAAAIRPRRIRRLVRIALFLAVVACAAYVVWRYKQALLGG